VIVAMGIMVATSVQVLLTLLALWSFRKQRREIRLLRLAVARTAPPHTAAGAPPQTPSPVVLPVTVVRTDTADQPAAATDPRPTTVMNLPWVPSRKPSPVRADALVARYNREKGTAR
jgi:hypothetical protein